jgi:hypothetical protein
MNVAERETIVMRLRAVPETACMGQDVAKTWCGVLERIDQHPDGELKREMIRQYAKEIAGIELCAFCWRPIDHLLRMLLVPARVQ